MLPKRAVFPEPSPTLCVTFFTCKGTGVAGTADLQHTYSSAVLYLDAQALPYELVWLDNGGAKDEHDSFIARGAQFEAHPRNPSNEGLFRAVNDVWFRDRGCRSGVPYVMSLEDDRITRPDLLMPPQLGRVRHLALALEVLQHDSIVAGVRLKDEWSDEPIARAAATELHLVDAQLPMRDVPSGRVRYALHCMALSSGFVWGSFSMAAVVYDRERLRKAVGLLMEGSPHDAMSYDYAEGQYAVRVGLAGLCTARPLLHDACTTLDMDNTPITNHTALLSPANGRPCHQVFIETRAPRERRLDEYDWFFYGTSMQSDSEAAIAKEQTEQGRESQRAAATAQKQHQQPPAAQEQEQSAAFSSDEDDDSTVANACDGTPLTSRAHTAFRALDAGTRAASQSKDYTAAAAAYMEMVVLFGDAAAVVRAFECAGVTAFYADHLQRWHLKHGLPTPPAELGGSRLDSRPPPPPPPSSPLPSPRPVPTSQPAPPNPSCGVHGSASPDDTCAAASAAVTSTPAHVSAAAPLPGQHTDGAPTPPDASARWRPTAGGWRDVPAPPRRMRGHPPPPIPPVIIQTWADAASIPEAYRVHVEQIVRAHPGWTHLFFDDADIRDFIHERTPRWLPLYESLIHAPIQRIDLFRYLAVEHYGGFYLDVDVALRRPLHPLRELAERCVFPYERLVDNRTHPTLLTHTRTAALIGQYAFGAAPRHPFMRAILRYIRRAAIEPSWARVPAPPPGEEDDDKTVHYTTGPAIVTRALVEGGFMGRVHVLCDPTALGPADPGGWGAFGAYAFHLHAGTWKRAELDTRKLIARASRHSAAGRHEEAAGSIKRAIIHGGAATLPPAELQQLWVAYQDSYMRSGQPANALTSVAWDRIAAHQFELAITDLDQGEGVASGYSDKEARGRIHTLRYLALAGAASRAQDAEIGRILAASSGGSADAPPPAGARAALLKAAAAELDRAVELMPSAASHRLLHATERLRGTAVHVAEAVPELAKGLALETDEADARGGTSSQSSQEPPLTPLSAAYVLYVWQTAKLLRPALRASPSVARLVRELRTPRHAVGATPCDLERTGEGEDDEEEEWGAEVEGSGDDAEAARSAAVTEAARAAAAAQEASSATRPLWEWPPGGVKPQPPRLAGSLAVDVAKAEVGAGRSSGGATQAWLMVNEHGVPALELR